MSESHFSITNPRASSSPLFSAPVVEDKQACNSLCTACPANLPSLNIKQGAAGDMIYIHHTGELLTDRDIQDRGDKMPGLCLGR